MQRAGGRDADPGLRTVRAGHQEPASSVAVGVCGRCTDDGRSAEAKGGPCRGPAAYGASGRHGRRPPAPGPRHRVGCGCWPGRRPAQPRRADAPGPQRCRRPPDRSGLDARSDGWVVGQSRSSHAPYPTRRTRHRNSDNGGGKRWGKASHVPHLWRDEAFIRRESLELVTISHYMPSPPVTSNTWPVM